MDLDLASDDVISEDQKRSQPKLPKTKSRTISGQFPCPCVTFNNAELHQIWKSHLRRRYKYTCDKPTKDKELGEGEARSSDGSTSRHDGDKIMYSSASCRKETLRGGLALMKSRTYQVGSRVCKSLANCFGVTLSPTSAYRPLHSAEVHPPLNTREKLGHPVVKTQEHTAQFDGSSMVVPRWFQFHSQVIGEGHQVPPPAQTQVMCDDAIYEEPSHEDDDGVSPKSRNEWKTNLHDAEENQRVHQLQEEQSPPQFAQLHMQAASRKAWPQVFPEKFRRQSKQLGGRNQCPQCNSTGSPKFEGIYPGESHRLRSQFKSGFHPQFSGDDRRAKFTNFNPDFSPSSHFASSTRRSAYELLDGLSEGQQGSSISEVKFSQATQTDEASKNCSDLVLRDKNRTFCKSDVPERDSNVQSRKGRSNSRLATGDGAIAQRSDDLQTTLQIDDKFIHHLFGTDYDIKTRNYRKFNGKVSNVLNYDVSDLLCSGADGMTSSSKSCSAAHDDHDDSSPMRYHRALDSLQQKINKWEVIAKMNGYETK